MFSQLLGLGKVQNVKSFGSESLTSPALSCVTVKSFYCGYFGVKQRPYLHVSLPQLCSPTVFLDDYLLFYNTVVKKCGRRRWKMSKIQ